MTMIRTAPLADEDLRAALSHAIEALNENAAIIYPTETIYGLGARALNADALNAAFVAKKRPQEKAPPVLIGSREQLDLLAREVSHEARVLMEKHWPGALTLVLPARDDLPAALLTKNERGENTIAVRQTAQRVARLLCEECGPLVATSANLSGATGNAAAPRVLSDVADELKARVAACVDDGEVGGLPSTIIDATAFPFRVLREGAISSCEL